MENSEDTTNGLQKSKRHLKRKSEEGSTSGSCIGGNTLQNDSSKLRKYSRRIPPTEAEECIADDKTIQTEMKENMLFLSCHSPGYAVKSSKGTTAKNYSRSKDKKKLLVPPLDGLNEHREFSECATGFILSPRADKPYQCHFCAKQFKYFSNLKSHMNIIHRKLIENSPKDSKTSTVGSGQVFQCEICLRNFKYFSNLRTHRLVHTSEVETCNSGID